MEVVEEHLNRRETRTGLRKVGRESECSSKKKHHQWESEMTRKGIRETSEMKDEGPTEWEPSHGRSEVRCHHRLLTTNHNIE